MDAPDGGDRPTLVLYRSELPEAPTLRPGWADQALPIYQRAPHQVTAALRGTSACAGCGASQRYELAVVVDRLERPDLWDATVGGWFTRQACLCGHEAPGDRPLLLRESSGALTLLTDASQDPAEWQETAGRLLAILPDWALPDDPIEVRILRRPGPGDPPELPLATVREGLARLDAADPMPVGEAVRLLTEALRQISREEDPLAWARRQLRLGHTLITARIPGSRGVRALRDAVAGYDGLDVPVEEVALAHLVLGQAVLDRPHNGVVSASGAVAAFETVARLLEGSGPAGSALLVQSRLGLARALLRRGGEGDAERSTTLFESLAAVDPAELGLGDTPGSLHAEIVAAQLAAHDVEAALATLDRARAARLAPAEAVAAAESVLAEAERTGVSRLRDAAALRVAEALLDRIPVGQGPNMERVIEILVPELAVTPAGDDDPTQWARRHAAVGSAYGLRLAGDPIENNRRAVLHLELAAGVLRDTASVWSRRCQHQLGWAYLRSREGEPSANLDRAIGAFRAAYDGEADIAQDLAKVLIQRDRDDDLTAAVRLLEGVRGRYPRASDPFVWVQVTGVLVMALGLRGHPGDRRRAIAESEQALAACGQDERLEPARAAMQVNLANLLARDPDDLERAIAETETALAVLTPQWHPALHRGAAENLARLLQRAGRWPKALEAWQSALDAANLEYGVAVTDESRAEAVAQTTTLYAATVAACLQQIPPRRRDAFLIAEEGRSRLLRTRLGGLSVPVPPELADEPRITREQQLVAQARRLRADADDPAQLDQRPRLVHTLEATHTELNTLWDELAHDARTAGYVALRRGDAPSWLKLTAWLAAHPRPAALLEYYTLEERVVAFVVTPAAVQPVVVELDATSATVADLTRRLRREVHLHDPDWDVGESWQGPAAPLLAPVIAHLSGVEVLYVIPHGLLHGIPLHAVETDGVPLLERCTVVYAPSAAAASRVGPGPPGGRTDRALVVGNPTGDLAHAEREARAVAEALGVVPLIGPAATSERVKHALRDAESAHFACHAFYDPTDPFASGIELADGVLTAREIASTELPTRQFVLSACESGVQAVQAGDELAGLAQALLYAGTRSLVATLWSVDDPVSAGIMLDFHARSGADPADALRRAVLAARAAGAHTHHWASFIAYGRAA